jgi:hypothetical protein
LWWLLQAGIAGAALHLYRVAVAVLNAPFCCQLSIAYNNHVVGNDEDMYVALASLT